MLSFFRKNKKPPDTPENQKPSVTVAPINDYSEQYKRQLSYSFGSLQGIGSRTMQEDAFCFVNADDVTGIVRKGFLAVVADGMGGMENGREAGSIAAQIIGASFDSLDYSGNIPGQLNRSVRHAGQTIFRRLGSGSGSTAIVCMVYQGELYYSSVGDSYLMLKRDGQLLRINRPQNILNRTYLEIIRSGSTDPAPADNDPAREALTGYLGMPENEDIDYFRKPLRLHDGDVIMLCSDGVAGFLSERCILQCLESSQPSQMLSEIDRCIKEINVPYQDNYTALIIKCEY